LHAGIGLLEATKSVEELVSSTIEVLVVGRRGLSVSLATTHDLLDHVLINAIAVALELRVLAGSLDDFADLVLDVLLRLLISGSVLLSSRGKALDSLNSVINKRSKTAKFLHGRVFGRELVDELLSIVDGAAELTKRLIDLGSELGVVQGRVTGVDKVLSLLAKIRRSVLEKVAGVRALLVVSAVVDVVGELKRLGDKRLNLACEVLRLVADLAGINIIDLILELVSGEVETLKVGTVDDLKEANSLAGHDTAGVNETVPAILAVTTVRLEDIDGPVHAIGGRIDCASSLVDLRGDLGEFGVVSLGKFTSDRSKAASSLVHDLGSRRKLVRDWRVLLGENDNEQDEFRYTIKEIINDLTNNL